MLKKMLFALLLFQVLTIGVSNANDYNSNVYNHFSKHVAHHLVANGRPHAWCGWQMRQWFGGDSSYNLAANWSHRGVSTNAHVGAVVVWPHHVGYITGFDTSRHLWIVRSGNDGHQVRERPRSIAGTIAIREL